MKSLEMLLTWGHQLLGGERKSVRYWLLGGEQLVVVVVVVVVVAVEM